MSPSVEDLIAAARSVQGEFSLTRKYVAGGVAAALLTGGGRIVTGICVELACGIGFCAEHAAAAEMLKDRETRVLMAVAVNDERIVAPCGRCRELFVQLDEDNVATEIVLARDRVVPLGELLPELWHEASRRP